jgi:hypothetical protein
MKTFYEARIEHLTITDRVRIDCQCGRTAFIAVQGLCQPDHRLIRDLKPLLRCENCGERGTVELTIVWADRDAYADPKTTT